MEDLWRCKLAENMWAAWVCLTTELLWRNVLYKCIIWLVFRFPACILNNCITYIIHSITSCNMQYWLKNMWRFILLLFITCSVLCTWAFSTYQAHTTTVHKSKQCSPTHTIHRRLQQAAKWTFMCILTNIAYYVKLYCELYI